ncbi:TAXI family TRAP transporter solute-binding subunit [Microbulbifer sp. S227A]|uniref:TAXI family TRAP transporter solute-binding subunit n=1 Tax=Microbulbifer sp. S227A TaxID=3415131 RepID=UPI003C7E94A5
MKKSRVFSTLIGAVLSLPLSLSSAIAADPVNLTIIAQQPGSSFYAYATTISQLLNESLPEGSSVNIVPRGGSVANPTALNAGNGDLAFGLSYTAKLAYLGDEEVYAGRGAHKNIMGVTGGMHMSYTYVLARRDYIEKTGLSSLEEMLASDDLPRIAMKPQGSIVLPIAENILSTYGWSLEKLRDAKKLTQGQPSQISEMLRDNRVDVYFENAPTNHAGVTEVTLTNDMMFLPISKEASDLLVENGMTAQTVPAGTYRGMEEDYETTATGMVIMANKNSSEDAIYEFTKAIAEGYNQLVSENAALSHWDPKATIGIEFTALPLHPGAEKYYKEAGWK